MRNLAAELRDQAARTVLPDYQDKFERAARDLEALAQRLESHSRFHLAP
ncbi:MAG: hypothetical protein RL274_2469 [Pseudomonadota bacterium]